MYTRWSQPVSVETVRTILLCAVFVCCCCCASVLAGLDQQESRRGCAEGCKRVCARRAGLLSWRQCRRSCCSHDRLGRSRQVRCSALAGNKLAARTGAAVHQYGISDAAVGTTTRSCTTCVSQHQVSWLLLDWYLCLLPLPVLLQYSHHQGYGAASSAGQPAAAVAVCRHWPSVHGACWNVQAAAWRGCAADTAAV